MNLTPPPLQKNKLINQWTAIFIIFPVLKNSINCLWANKTVADCELLNYFIFKTKQRK